MLQSQLLPRGSPRQHSGWDETGPASLPILAKGAAVLASLFWEICLTLSKLQVADQGSEHSALNWSMSSHLSSVS